MPRVVRSHEPHYQYQADATLSQANPVSGTKYTVLDTVNNARIIYIAVVVTWTVQPSPLECWVTIDGETQRFRVANPATATEYGAHMQEDTSTGDGILLATSAAVPSKYRGFLLEGKSIKVEVEITGGTVQNLSARVKYAKKV